MSLRHEQYRSLELSRELLLDILHTPTRPKTVKELKARAASALRHFPPLGISNEPLFSKDTFKTEDKRVPVGYATKIIWGRPINLRAKKAKE